MLLLFFPAISTLSFFGLFSSIFSTHLRKPRRRKLHPELGRGGERGDVLWVEVDDVKGRKNGFSKIGLSEEKKTKGG